MPDNPARIPEGRFLPGRAVHDDDLVGQPCVLLLCDQQAAVSSSDELSTAQHRHRSLLVLGSHQMHIPAVLAVVGDVLTISHHVICACHDAACMLPVSGASTGFGEAEADAFETPHMRCRAVRRDAAAALESRRSMFQRDKACMPAHILHRLRTPCAACYLACTPCCVEACCCETCSRTRAAPG